MPASRGGDIHGASPRWLNERWRPMLKLGSWQAGGSKLRDCHNGVARRNVAVHRRLPTPLIHLARNQSKPDRLSPHHRTSMRRRLLPLRGHLDGSEPLSQ